MLSKVNLPQPLGPMIANVLTHGDCQVQIDNRGDIAVVIMLIDTFQAPKSGLPFFADVSVESINSIRPTTSLSTVGFH